MRCKEKKRQFTLHTLYVPKEKESIDLIVLGCYMWNPPGRSGTWRCSPDFVCPADLLNFAGDGDQHSRKRLAHLPLASFGKGGMALNPRAVEEGTPITYRASDSTFTSVLQKKRNFHLVKKCLAEQ